MSRKKWSPTMMVGFIDSVGTWVAWATNRVNIRTNITVNAITPGVIDTSMTLSAEVRSQIETLVPLRRIGEPEDIAYPALFLASRMGAYITGATIDVNGGILKR